MQNASDTVVDIGMYNTYPVESVLGGALIGLATVMFFSGKVAGNSGALRACIATNGTREWHKQMFVLGLVAAGAISGAATPWAYETYEPISTGWPFVTSGGLLVGLGVSLQNGCTSGHGLAGLSRLSLRSAVATPIFMLSAIFAAIAKSGFVVGAIMPFADTPAEHLTAVYAFSAAAAALLISLALASWAIHGEDSTSDLQAYAGLACGSIFGLGLALGGMVRPSTVIGALSLTRWDATLWILFCSALLVTFVIFRGAEWLARVPQARAVSNSWQDVDTNLILGAVLFGVGWGLTGFCPGPLIVSAAAAPFVTPNLGANLALPLMNLIFVVIGMSLAPHLVILTGLPPLRSSNTSGAKGGECARVGMASQGVYAASSDANATVGELQEALQKDPLIVDVRFADGREAEAGNPFLSFFGTLSAPWQSESRTVPTAVLTQELLLDYIKRGEKIIVHCRKGARARAAANFLAAQHSLARAPFLCCGLEEMRAAMPPAAAHEHGEGLYKAKEEEKQGHGSGLLFRQLFDGPFDGPDGSTSAKSSTYTYILGCAQSREAVIIDPVLERIPRDVAELARMGLNPVLAFNTHCHADHITATGSLKKIFPGLRSCISAASRAEADVKLQPRTEVKWGAGGQRRLIVLPTPGHTEGCVSFHDPDLRAVFTGDALLIGGCGRTDFQGGSAETLFDSVHEELFTLPGDTLVYPGHDYRGRLRSTIRDERASNPRLASKSKDEFVTIMANLGLKRPSCMDVAVPANMKCGV